MITESELRYIFSGMNKNTERSEYRLQERINSINGNRRINNKPEITLQMLLDEGWLKKVPVPTNCRPDLAFMYDRRYMLTQKAITILE